MSMLVLTIKSDNDAIEVISQGRRLALIRILRFGRRGDGVRIGLAADKNIVFVRRKLENPKEQNS